MKWRCEFCGKPHEEDDPPCDNCGHSGFEKAVVPRTDLAEGEREPALVWVCAECGREHPKNTPPCSRCGAATLEKQRQAIDETELTAPGYRDLLTPGYVLAALLAVLGTIVLVFAITGGVAVPGTGLGAGGASGSGGDGLAVNGPVPGNATSVGGTQLRAVEQAYLDALGDPSETGPGAGTPAAAPERSAALDALATDANQQQLAWTVGPTTATAEQRQRFSAELDDRVVSECDGQPGTILGLPVTVAPEHGAAALGDRLADAVTTEWTAETRPTAIGVDVHAVGDRLYLLQLTCAA